MTTGGTKEPYAWDVRGSIVEAKREVRESNLLSSQEKRLWNITLSTLEILFAPATESEEAEAKAWEESPDGIAHALARAVGEHYDLIGMGVQPNAPESLWICASDKRKEVLELVKKYREAVKE